MTKNHFKDAMSLLASGVSVLTCRDKDKNFGITISSLASVGVNPPTVMVCVEGQSPVVAAIRNSRRFGVTILRSDQEQIGVRFASSQLSFEDRFAATKHEVLNDSPLLEGGLAKMTCDLEQEVSVSANVVFFGRISFVEAHEGEPLIYFHRNWRNLKN